MCKLHRESEGTEREGKKKETKTQIYDKGNSKKRNRIGSCKV